MILKKIKKYLLHPSYVIAKLDDFGIIKLSDTTKIKIRYKECFNKKINLENPITFNEKLQWLKLNNRKEIYTTMVDKAEAKKYVSNIIGEEYIIPTIGVFEKFSDIDFAKLPEQFVMKCTHDSGGVIICKEKGKFNIKKARKKINKLLKKNFYLFGREWPYKNVKPRIIIEEYKEDKKYKELRDYKFFCFNGTVKLCYIASDRYSEDEETKFDFFDDKFNHINVKNGHPNANVLPDKPAKFEEMKRLAEELSVNIPHIRIDFYEVDNKIYFGEITFFHMCGFTPFDPEEYDYIFGKYIDINLVKK